jgi:uncharacterized protein
VIRNASCPCAHTTPTSVATIITVWKPTLDMERIRQICQKHHIRRLTLFGDMLYDDFHADSDVAFVFDDVPTGRLSTLRRHLAAEEDFVASIGRPVQLVSRKHVETTMKEQYPHRSKQILAEEQVIYEAEAALPSPRSDRSRRRRKRRKQQARARSRAATR